MLYKQYDAMNAGVYAADVPAVLHGQRVAASGTGFVDAGGFDARFRRAEDVELAYRLRPRRAAVRLEPRRRSATTTPTGPFDSWLRTAHDYGVNEVVFGRDEGQDSTLAASGPSSPGAVPSIRGPGASAAWPAPWLEPALDRAAARRSPSAPTGRRQAGQPATR